MVKSLKGHTCFQPWAVKLEYTDGMRFKVNAKRIKLYFDNTDEVKTMELWTFGEVYVTKWSKLCRDHKSSATWRQPDILVVVFMYFC